jgi:hypothetical protein
MVPLQNMSKKEREETPYSFAYYLIHEIKVRFHVKKIAVLYARGDSVYYWFKDDVEVWDKERDARNYRGPHPVIAHPPCGPWGCLSWSSQESKDHGIWAMQCAHKWGGVVEQPYSSKLFWHYGKLGCSIQRLNQSDYGHRAEKKTCLYWFLPQDLRHIAAASPSSERQD